jgi:hypothetical protein
VAEATALVTRPNVQAKHWKGGVPPFKRYYRPSIAYRLALVGEGRFDTMLTFRDTWEWDIAAGAIVIEEAGRHSERCLRRAHHFQRRASPSARGIVAAPGRTARQASASQTRGAEICRGLAARRSTSGGCGTLADTLAIAVTSSRAPRANQGGTEHHQYIAHQIVDENRHGLHTNDIAPMLAWREYGSPYPVAPTGGLTATADP